MSRVDDLVDGALEALVAPSFTKVGYEVRRRLDGWTPLDGYDLRGRTYVVTGATSGLGLAAADALAVAGAEVLVVGRSASKTERVVDELRDRTGSAAIEAVVADVGDLDQVRAAADAIRTGRTRLDGLLHNAGALDHERRTTPSGIEATIASQVVGPFLLTTLLLDLLRSAGPGRVITMSSGGMYAAALTVDHLQLDDEHYDGTKQYALAKRAQVTLNERWGELVDPAEVVFHSVHPGWADTPGVAASLPTFRKVVGPLLRDPAAGADTLVWLAADDGEPLASTGRFWLDRRTRPIHRLPNTRRSDTPERRSELWRWVAGEAVGDLAYLP